MAFTYQPAERMSVVLRAVMVELRGGPEPPSNTSFNLYKPRSAVVPARRGSTIDMDDDENGISQQWKKRQTSRPRAGTGVRAKVRTSSMSTTMSMGHNRRPNLSVKTPLPPRFDDMDRNTNTDGYILVPPESDLASWPVTVSSEPPDLSNVLSTPSTTMSSSVPRHSGAWMGTEFEQQDAIDQLANAHFPELNAFDDNNAMEGAMTNLDFMALGDGGEWHLGKEWGDGLTGGDLDGFPPVGAFGMGFGGEGKF